MKFLRILRCAFLAPFLMGGGDGDGPSDMVFYERSVGTSSVNTEYQYDVVGKNATKERVVHASLDPKNAFRQCLDFIRNIAAKVTPIVVVSDFTDSRGKDIEIIDKKVPMLIGQINMKGYVLNPVISFAGLGDAKFDKAPIQVGKFYYDDKIDEVLSCMWPEKGGGGTGQESYELMGYFYAYHSTLEANDRGEKGYLFFIGDEGFYDKVSKDEVKRIIGDDIPEDLDSKKVFADLQDKYEVFFIFPQKTWEKRKTDIDNEIKKRVERAGGLYEGVDIRVSLIWHNTNDLDLHVITPSGFHIYYPSENKKAPCGGFLDVDMNVHGETTKPVENIRWEKGRARKGHYKVYVQNYAFHQSESIETQFTVEVEINGEIQHFEKVMPAYKTRENSNILILEFDYDPEQRITETKDKYANYQDDVIVAQWSSVIPEDHVLRLKDPKGIVDLIIGVLARYGGRELSDYIKDMRDRDQTIERQNDIETALRPLDNSLVPEITVDMKMPDNKPVNKTTGSKTRRL